MKNIHLVPTDRPSRLRVGGNGNFVFGMIQTSIQSKNDDFANQHLYITSDEEIEEGEYGVCLSLVKEGLKSHLAVFKMDCDQRHSMELLGGRKKAQVLKIILTTDQDLIKDGVQAIDDEFLEWFVKNPSCEYVEIQCRYSFYAGQDLIHYKIIIPQEEPKQDYSKVHLRHCYQGEYEDTCKYGEDDCPAKPLEESKQETLKEAAEKHRKHWVNNIGLTMSDMFIAGANWQSERMYSEEDIDILFELIKDNQRKWERFDNKLIKEKPKSFDEIFEQFKKLKMSHERYLFNPRG